MFMENNGSLIEGILSGVISGLIVGAVLYLLTLWTEKRSESFKYKNSFNAKEINNIILKLREVNFLFFDNIELYVSNQDCFYYNIIAPINNCNFLELDEIEREKVIDLFEMIDQWTNEALVLINRSRVYKKDRNVKKNFKKFSQSINQSNRVCSN